MIDTTGLEHFPCYPKTRLCWLTQEDIKCLGKYCRQLALLDPIYVVETPYGELRRNRAHLHIRTDTQLPVDASSTDTTLSQPVTIRAGPVTRSQTGTALRPPDRLQY